MAGDTSNDRGPNLLALDLASKTGWACGRLGESIKSGSLKLQTEDIGTALLSLNNHVFGLHKADPLDAIYFEAPFLKPEKTTYQTIVFLNSLSSFALFIGRFLRIPVREAAVQSIRKNFLGVARPKDKKRAVIDECLRRGFMPVDDNEADAIALWSYGAFNQWPERLMQINRSSANAQRPLI